MAGGLQRALAGALAPLAVLAVVVSGISAAVVYPGPAEPTGPTPEPSTGPGADVLLPEGKEVVTGDERDNATFLVPDQPPWLIRERSDEIGYDTTEGKVDVYGPVTYDEGFCDRLGGFVPRAFVGFTDPVAADETTPRDSAGEILAEWTRVSSVEDDGGRLEVTEPTLSPVRLDDGSAAWTAGAVVLDEPRRDRCGSNPVEIRVLSVLTGDFVANLVMVRGVTAEGGDLADNPDAATADEILRSLDPR